VRDLKNNKSIQLTNAGFTLIEVLIAITVLSMLMATMYTIVSNSTDTKDKIIAEDKDSLQLITALDRMEQDFSQIYSPLYHSAKYVKKSSDQYEFQSNIDEDGNPKIVSPLDSFEASERFPSISTSADIVPALQNESKSEIIFMTTANRRILKDSKQSRFGWVKYSLRSSTRDDDFKRDGGDYELVRSIETENIYNKEFDWKNIKEYPLLRDIKSFQFLFWNAKTEKFVDKLELLSADQETPRLIRVKLVWINSDNNEIEVVRTFRPLAPYFDTEKDEKEKEAAKAGNQQTDPSNPLINNEEEQ